MTGTRKARSGAVSSRRKASARLRQTGRAPLRSEIMYGFSPRHSHRELPLAPCYKALGEPHHVPVSPTPLPEPKMIHFNKPLALELGLDVSEADSSKLLEILAGNRPWPKYEPLASVYAGHQFGVWALQLGDGRALMIVEVRTPAGARMELRLKGSGPTPYSRGLDGRAVKFMPSVATWRFWCCANVSESIASSTCGRLRSPPRWSVWWRCVTLHVSSVVDGLYVRPSPLFGAGRCGVSRGRAAAAGVQSLCC